MDEDKRLYQEFLDGDQKAFEQLVLSHKAHLIYFINRYVSDVHMSEDIAQEVFAFLFVYKERYHFQSSVKTYLYAIARNKATDYMRKARRIVPLEEYREEAAEDSELFDQVVKKDEQRMVRDGIQRLKPEYQAALQLVDFEDLSYQEAAAVLQKSLPQFKVLLYRARKALAVLLRKEGYTNEN